MESGVYDIPRPVGTPMIQPEAGLVPVNGFDGQGFRLGCGGGYFDRTLASCERRPPCIGPGFETARIDSIFPQPHDVPLDFIVTELGIHQREHEGLELVAEHAAGRKAADLLLRTGGRDPGLPTP